MSDEAAKYNAAAYPAEKFSQLEIQVCSNGYLITTAHRPDLDSGSRRMMAIESWVAQGGIDVLCNVLGQIILDRDPT